jgi:uncharacterized protein YajQ (UPF0234 family)
MLEILKLKLSKRGIDVACLKIEPVTTGRPQAQGWTPFILDTNGDGKRGDYVAHDQPLDPQKDKQVRISGKSRDDLQSAIAMVKKGSFELPLQFTNFRD